jgi:Fe-S cluster assembly scaffold protein SufB
LISQSRGLGDVYKRQMEYALELNKLIEMQMEGAVG